MTFPLSISQLAAIVDGRFSNSDCGHKKVSGGCIDSRSVSTDDCFFALRGDRTHGVLFADQAIANGAACVVTDSAELNCTSGNTRPDVPALVAVDSAETDGRIIRVADSTVALQSLGRWNRQQSDALVVGVTGSVGKTTTRQMISHVLASRFSGVQSQGNQNNELGVPLSLLKLKPEHDFAVLELAASKTGDLAFLADIVHPEFAVVTRVAATHLKSFGDLNAICQAKSELPAAIGADGTVFLNADDPAVLSMSRSTSAEVVLFGTTVAAEFRATSIRSRDGISQFDVDGQLFQLLGGSHLITGALAAIAIGRVAGLNGSVIAESLAQYQPDSGRGRIVQRQPWTVIDETYNASPASVLAAIRTLNEFVSARRRILVLGDMLELGPQAAQFHHDIGRALSDTQIEHTLTFGEFAEQIARGARQAGVSANRLSVFHDMPTLLSMLDCVLAPGDVVLIKGSRSMQMERVVKALCAESVSVNRSAA
jgi:UDP-N-acetylmuramoyl-tripeptide--D-alanyl-D-alanine ligase